jgi:hypothetical protein
MADDYRGGGTPLWGWVLILVVLAMFVGVVVKSLATGGYNP